MGDDTDDRKLFLERMAGVRPLRGGQERPDRPRPAAEARFTRADERAVLRESLAGEQSPDSHEEFTYASPGLSRTVLRKLRRGAYSIASELDLHGMNARDARAALDEFLAESIAARYQCVRIIHGKGTRSGHGGPVLKPKVVRWLRRRNAVLAFTTARPVDGGTGALYVLLRA